MQQNNKINILVENLDQIDYKFDLVMNNINSKCLKTLHQDFYPLIEKILPKLKNYSPFVLNFKTLETNNIYNIFENLNMLIQKFPNLQIVDVLYFKYKNEIIPSVVLKYFGDSLFFYESYHVNQNIKFTNFIKGDTHNEYVDNILDRYTNIQDESFKILDLSYDKGTIAKTCLIRGINCVSFENDKKKIQSFEKMKNEIEAQLNLF